MCKNFNSPISIIGIGENGISGLTRSALRTLAEADIIFGGARHIAFLPFELQQKAKKWEKPFLKNINIIKDLRKEAETGGRAISIACLASGDPMFFGAGSSFLRYFPISDLTIYPNISSFSYAAAKLGWALQDVKCCSIHGRPLESILRFIADKAKLLILSEDGDSPAALCRLLKTRGLGQSRIAVLEHLGGEKEKIYHHHIADLTESPQKFADLNIMALDCKANDTAADLPLSTVLPDSAFIHDGQITKQPIRAAVLAFLAPKYSELLWDIGAGSGSIGIEWLRLGHQTRAVAIEQNPQRAANIMANARNLGVPDLKLLEGRAQDIIPQISDKEGRPNAIFIGGNVGDFGLLEQCFAALKPGGRLIANAVTLEGEAALARLSEKYGGNRTRIAVQNEETIGRRHIMRPALPVTIFVAQKTDKD